MKHNVTFSNIILCGVQNLEWIIFYHRCTTVWVFPWGQ